MHIADASGRGQDHCELVGGSELTANTVMLRSLTVKGINYPVLSSTCFVEITLTSLHSRLSRNIW